MISVVQEDGFDNTPTPLYIEKVMHGIPVQVNPELSTKAPHLQSRLGTLVDIEYTFDQPGENSNSVETICEQLGDISKVVTVVGAEWPAILGNVQGIETVVGIDINAAQVEHYTKMITNPKLALEQKVSRVVANHKSGDWPLVVDDVTRLSDLASVQFLRNVDLVYLSNLPEYQSYEHFQETLQNIAEYLPSGAHIALVGSVQRMQEHPLSERVSQWAENLQEILGREVTVQNNDSFDLPPAGSTGRALDDFYVITV